MYSRIVKVIAVTGILVVGARTAEGHEILSLESVLHNGPSSSAHWSQDAFYCYRGRGGLRVLQVVPGGLMGGGGVLVTAPQRGFMPSDMTIFIRGAINGVVDGDALPAVDLKLDGVYQYTTALGAPATVRAFRQLTSEESKWIGDTLAAEARQRQAQKEAERKALRETIARKLKEIETSYFEEQEKSKKATEDFFSSLKIDLRKNVYIERSLLLHMDFEVQRNVKLDELRQAMLSKDWERCFKITYENFFEGWESRDQDEYGHVSRIKEKPSVSFDALAVKTIFEQIEGYDFVENEDDSFKYIFEAYGNKNWNRCVNIADQIMKQHTAGKEVRIYKDKVKAVILGYPSVEELKVLFSDFLAYEFPCDLIDKRPAEQKRGYRDIVIVRKNIEWDSVVNTCAGIQKEKVNTAGKSSYPVHRRRRPVDGAGFFEDKGRLTVQLRNMPCYISTKDTIDNITGKWNDSDKSLQNRVKRISTDFAEDKISEKEYKDGIISVAKILEEQIMATFVNIEKTNPSKARAGTEPIAVGGGNDSQAELAEYMKGKFASLHFDIASNTYVAPKWRNLIAVEVDDLWPRKIEGLIRAEKWLELINAVSAILGLDTKYDSIPNKAIVDELYRSFQNSVVGIKIGLVDTEEGDNIRRNNTRDGLSVFLVDGRVNYVPPLRWDSNWSANLEIRAFGVLPAKIFVVDNIEDMAQDDYSAGLKSSVGSRECEKFVSYCIKHTSLIKRNNCSYSDGGKFGLTKSPATVLIDEKAQAAKTDKELFSRLWKTIQPENPNATKVEQNLSRLKCGMENEALAKIYDKYSDDKCKDVVNRLSAEMRSVRSLKSADERMSAREKLLNKYKGIFLTGLGQRMNKIIGADTPQGQSAAPTDGGQPVAAGASVAYQKCPDCDGTKYIKEEAVCNRCNGQGQIEKVKLGLNGTSRRVINKCANCNGNGVATKKTPCATCKGKGKIRIE